MSKKQIGLAVFFTICIFSTLIGWLSGYDFDYRSGGVAMWVCFTVVIAAMTGVLFVADI